MLKVQVRAAADNELRMLLKTIRAFPRRLGLGAMRMNNLRMVRTRLDNQERLAPGREPI
jgi:hypothetical protein